MTRLTPIVPTRKMSGGTVEQSTYIIDGKRYEAVPIEAMRTSNWSPTAHCWVRPLTAMESAYVDFLNDLEQLRKCGDTTVYAWESFPAFRADHPELEDEA